MAKTLVIGSKFRGHDASVFVVAPQERKIVAVSEERMTRYKHDRIFPVKALARSLGYAGIDPHTVERVVLCNSFLLMRDEALPRYFYEVEMLMRAHFNAAYKRDFENAHKEFAKLGVAGKLWSLLGSTAGWGIIAYKALGVLRGGKRVSMESIQRAWLNGVFPNAALDIRYYDHEYCHAACSYITSPYDEATLFTFDGWGDKHFSHVYKAKGGVLERVASSPKEFVHRIQVGQGHEIYASVGGIYSYITELLGFTPEEDEGKVEALAAYGTPIPELYDAMLSLVAIGDDLSMSIDAERGSKVLAVAKMEAYKEAHTREDISATVQKFLEEATRRYLPRVLERTGSNNVVLSGGVAANVINNLMIYEEITKDIHITPAMADDGSSQGAAYAYLLEQGHDLSWLKQMHMPYYGTSYSREEVAQALKGYPELVVEDLGSEWPERTAELVAAGKIGAIFHGRMEWGPRALGNRSIIADPRDAKFQEIINKSIKRRPAFQPFCPSILDEEQGRLFESSYSNKHMTTAFRLKQEFWEALPSAIHIDGTARVQFVSEGDNPNYYRLLKKVKELTGFGVMINTSFNKHGRTIVESPHDAVRDFLDTDMEYVVIEGYKVTRTP